MMTLATRCAVALTTRLIGLLALVVPAASRGRWSEEWRAELEHAARMRGFSSFNLVRLAAGAIPDACSVRRVSLAQRRDRSVARSRPFQSLSQDFRYALRGLLAAPGFTLAVACSLAIALGANIVTFSILNTAVFRPFPGVRHQEGLVRVAVEVPARYGVDSRSTFADYLLLRDTLTGLSGLSARYFAEIALSVNGQPRTATAAFVSGNYFEILGVPAIAGRTFTGEDERRAWEAPAAVLSHELWRRDYGSSPAAIGDAILVNGTQVHVVGIAPQRFSGVRKGEYDVQVWVPLPLGELAWRDATSKPVRLSAAFQWFDYVGRRRPGISIEHLQAQADTAAKIIRSGSRDRNGTSARVSRVWLNDPGENAVFIMAFIAVPLTVLAVGCMNAANLLLARARHRRTEWAVRAAVGASGWRIVRQTLAESLLISVFSTICGLGLAAAALRIVASRFPLPLPLDLRVLLFAGSITILTAFAFGIAPALTARTTGLAGTRTTVIRGSVGARWRFALVTLQIALSLGLLATGTQFIRSWHARIPAAAVSEPERFVFASIDLDPLRYAPEAANDFYGRLLHQMSQRPEIAHAGTVNESFVDGDAVRIWLPGDSPSRRRGAFTKTIAGDVFPAMQLPILAGRSFTTDEHQGRPRVAIINRAFLESARDIRGLGQTLRVAARDGQYESGIDVIVTGIVENGLAKPYSAPTVYLPVGLIPEPLRTLVLRYRGDPANAATTVRQVVRQIDPRVPIRQLTTAQAAARDREEEDPLMAGGITILGVLALVLAAGGVYGIIAYVVSLRTQEIGVRLALGAQRRDILRMVLYQGLVPTITGCALGAGGAAAVGAIVRSRLYGTSPVDPIAFLAASALLLGVMLLASAIPARRASRVDPVVALRHE
jgi:predicted permease